MITTLYFDTSDTLYKNSDLKKAHSNAPIIQLAEIKNISIEDAKIVFMETKKKLLEKNSHVPKVSVMMELGISRIDMQQKIANINAKNFLDRDENLEKIISSLSQKYKLGIITNILKKAVLNVLDALKVSTENFSYFVTVDNTKKSKPNTEPFLKALELSGANPKSCVYIADSLKKDIIPAKNAGMKTIWITDSLEENNAVDIKISSINDLEKAVKKLC